MANLVVAMGKDPWPCTFRLARVVVAPDQRLCSLTEAMDLAREHFNRPKWLEASHYFLTPVYMEAPFLLSDVGLHMEDESAIPIGMAAFGLSPGDNAVKLATSEGAMSNLMLQCLLNLSADLVMIPPQLSLPRWTGMRRMKVGYESFIHFSAAYLPPKTPESQCLSQQLMILKDLKVPDPQVMLDMVDQLDSLRAASPGHGEGETRSGDKDDSKGETPKKSKQVALKDGLEKKKSHKSHESCLRHSSVDKSPTLSSHKASADLNANRLGSAMAQACFSMAKMTKVVEDNHNSKIADSLFAKKCLQRASADAIESMMDDIQAAHILADMWQIEKRISAHISLQRAKAYDTLVEQYRTEPRPHQERGKEKEDLGGTSTGIAEAEAEFYKSMMDLISTVLMEDGKVCGGHGVALASQHLAACTNPALKSSTHSMHGPATQEGMQDCDWRNAQVPFLQT